MKSKSLLIQLFRITIFSSLWLFALSDVTLAQDPIIIQGTIIDLNDEQPVPGAQIFLNGTTIGTSSTSDGSFSLKLYRSGIFELVVSSLGYETVSITINSEELDTGYVFGLKPRIYEMDEVVVKPDPKLWQQDFDLFKEKFIGTGPFSDDTNILNAEILNFYFDADERVFTAKANDQLIIENKALGYRIYYLLEYFIIDYKHSFHSYAGRPFFEPLITKRKRVRKRWTENRKKAYFGSFQHFTHSLLDQTVREDGYIIKQEKHTEDTRYLIDQILPQTQFFTQIDSATYSLKFEDYLNITYEKEYEDERYLMAIRSVFDSNPRTMVQHQNSIITLAADSVLIDKSGYIYDPTVIFSDGYWSFEKISDLLPLDYEPGN
ncbi:MAG TPA: hypothetical protein DEQ34_00710 [Balneolaceae bacterium]|nr:hypothetical protein [Balneolaceae bacterium]|tara:strand:+ start:267119 stop:268249 length:1131 start_codon:yes stop_codon:yes gene_type:complete